MDIKKEYERWLANATADADVVTELKTLDDAKIEDAFYRDLAFGTGGLRGVIGAGTNRMNVYTVAKASQGLADYLKKNFETPSVAIGYLSRFGRNYIEVGRYLERIFPVMRVRLIAVTDNYDSQSAWKTSDSIMVPMRNLLNDAYCRDISVKIKSQLAVKRKRGDFVGSFATYGSGRPNRNPTVCGASNGRFGS